MLTLHVIGRHDGFHFAAVVPRFLTGSKLGLPRFSRLKQARKTTHSFFTRLVN